jgi:Domain of unknown function (DUF4440)
MLLTVGGFLYPVPSHADSQTLRAWFQSREQALFDSVTRGDKELWDRTLDAGCIITSEDGVVEDKTKFLSELTPLPKGFSGYGKVRDLAVQDLGDAAVVHFWIDEHENVFGQQLFTTYVQTNTYRRRFGSWKIVAMQVTVVPRDLQPISTDALDWRAILGDYRFPGDERVQYRVFVRNGSLFGGRDEKSATSLIPLAPQVFYQKGSIHFMIFVKDSSGAVTEVREIHKYNEVRMQHLINTPSLHPQDG